VERDDAITKVTSLWALADHPNTPEHERATAIEMANKLMAKFQIDQLTIAAASDTHEDVIFKRLRITSVDQSSICEAQRVALAHQIALNNRCNAVVISGVEDTVDIETGKRIPGGSFLELIGYKSDVAFVEALNHSLGYSMIQAMAGEAVQTKNYKENFATGFVDRIRVRLAEIKRTVDHMADGTSTALVLRDRNAAVDDFMRKKYPNLTTYRVSSRTKFDPNAHERGRRAANAVDVGATKIGGDTRGRLGNGG